MKPTKLISLIAFTLILLSFTNHAHAWARHHLLTRLALEDLSKLQGLTATYVPIDRFLRKLGYLDHKELNTDFEIRKDYTFTARFGEIDGKKVSVIDIISQYSDEPDWGMDIGLFEKDQYPGLWRDAYVLMGGKEKGTPSQAHRHMYWARLNFFHPIRSLHVPKVFKPLGLAPERAKIFLKLSRKARSEGEEYWAARFLGNALHYLEDISSPFHSTQIPTKKFIFRALREGKNPFHFKNFIKRIIKVVSYYHFAFEGLMGMLLESTVAGNNKIAIQGLDEIFKVVKRNSGKFKDLSYSKEHGLRKLFINLHRYSEKESTKAAKASMKFFPSLPKKLVGFDLKAFMGSAWNDSVIEKATKPLRKNELKARNTILKSVQKMFEPVGVAIRSLVMNEYSTYP